MSIKEENFEIKNTIVVNGNYGLDDLLQDVIAYPIVLIRGSSVF